MRIAILSERDESTRETLTLPKWIPFSWSPVLEILNFAQETNADLIAMGAKARSGLAGHVPGTKAYKVVSEAHCPVLTVKS